MSKEYFQFPLCVLSMSDDRVKLLNDIMGYCIVEKAKEYEYEVFDLGNEGYSYDDLDNIEYDPDNEQHMKILKAAKFFGVKVHNVPAQIEQHMRVDLFISNFVFKYGRDSYTAINVSLAFECRDKGFSFELLKILCAVYAIMGKPKKNDKYKSKRFKQITLDRIRYAMHGFRSKSLYKKSKK